MNLMTWQGAFKKWYAFVRDHGWCKHQLQKRIGPDQHQYCLMGSRIQALWDNKIVLDDPQPYFDAQKEMMNWILDRYSDRAPAACSPITWLNDTHCNTKEDVLAEMERFAQERGIPL